MKHPHVFNIDIKPDCDIYDFEDEEYFSKAGFYLYSSSMVNPALAPAGKSSLMLQCRSVDGWMGRWGGGDKVAYRRLKEKAADTLIKRAAELIQGLTDSIEYKEAATPLTYERFTHNSGGASTAWSPNPKKSFFKSALGTNVVTPVKDLYIGSCWAVQLGGVPGAISAAYRCAKKIK
jgi:phytoene dehydrogenase-like protein